MLRESRPVVLDESVIDAPSRQLLAAFAGHPARVHAHLAMEPGPNGTWSVVIQIPSPMNERRRDVAICLVGDDRSPTLEFGAWHTHADLWDADPDAALALMLAYLTRIIAGTILLCEVPTAGDGLPYVVIDVRDPEAVLDDATSPYVPAQSKLLSWSGEHDLRLDDCARSLL